MSLVPRFTLTAVLAGFFVTLGLSSAASAGPIGEVAQLSEFADTRSGEIGWTSVAYNPDNGKSLVFYFARLDGDDSKKNFYAQVINEDGSASGAPLEVEGGPNQNYYYAAPDAVFNPASGGWTLFYQWGGINPSGPREIRSQQVSADGQLVGDPKTILDVSTDPAFNPASSFWVSQLSAAWDPQEERFLLGMFGAEALVTEAGVFYVQAAGRFVNPDGSPAGDRSFLLTDTEDGTGYGGGLSFSPASGNYLAGVGSLIAGGRAPGAQLIDRSGAIVGSLTTFVSEPRTRPSVTYNSVRDEFILAWARGGSNNANICTDSVGCRVWVQRVRASDGSLVGDTVEIFNTDVPGRFAFGPSIAAVPGVDEYIVTWHQGGWWGTSQSVFARRMNGDGTPIDAEPQLVSADGEALYSQRPSVTYSAEACAYQITWNGWSEAGGSSPYPAHIYGRQYEAPCQPDPPPPPPSGKPNLKVSVSTAKKVKAGKSFGASVKVTNRQDAPVSRSARSAPAEQVKTCVKLPKGTSVAKAKGAKVNGRSVCWTRSSLAIGSSVTYKLSIKAFRTASGKKALRATVTAENAEGESVSSSGQTSVRVIKAPKPKPKPPTG